MTVLSRVFQMTAFGLVLAAPARADLVVFSTGRTMSVADHRVKGETIVLVLRAGGEIVCDLAFIDRIVPEEPRSQVSSAVVATPAMSVMVDMIDAASVRHGVNAALVHAVIDVESAYRPEARSPKGAMGLMQLMPDTARQYAVANAYDPRANVDAGVGTCDPCLTASTFPWPWPPTMPARVPFAGSAVFRPIPRRART